MAVILDKHEPWLKTAEGRHVYEGYSATAGLLADAPLELWCRIANTWRSFLSAGRREWSLRTSREILEELVKETDPTKIKELKKELFDAYIREHGEPLDEG